MGEYIMTKIQVDSNDKAIILNGKALIASEGGVTPTGSISITENGTYDVTNYASANVNVPSGSSDVGIPREVSSNGVYQMPTQSFTFKLPSNATDIGENAIYYAFNGCTGLTSADLSSLTNISGSYAMYRTFYHCTSLTSVDLSSLTIVSGSRCLYSVFAECTNLTSLDLSSLTTVSGSQCLYYAFDNCTSLTSLDLSSLTTASGTQCLSYAFAGCTNLINISFPALTSTSFGSYTNQFNKMLRGVTGCTVHFPSNLQSVIGSWSDVTKGFGGTNTTVLFDLPATT